MTPPSALPTMIASTVCSPAFSNAACIACNARCRRESSQCSPTGVCPTPIIETFNILFACPSGCHALNCQTCLVYCQLTTIARIQGIIDLSPARNVFASLGRAILAVFNQVGYPQVERIRASARAVADQDDTVTWFGFIQRCRQP